MRLLRILVLIICYLTQVHVCPHTEGDGWALQDRQGNAVDKARFEEHFKPQVAAPATSRVVFLVACVFCPRASLRAL